MCKYFPLACCAHKRAWHFTIVFISFLSSIFQLTQLAPPLLTPNVSFLFALCGPCFNVCAFIIIILFTGGVCVYFICYVVWVLKEMEKKIESCPFDPYLAWQFGAKRFAIVHKRAWAFMLEYGVNANLSCTRNFWSFYIADIFRYAALLLWSFLLNGILIL